MIGVTRKLFENMPRVKDKEGMFLFEQIINKGEVKDAEKGELKPDNFRTFSYSNLVYATQASGERVQVMMTITLDAMIPEKKLPEPETKN